MRAVKGGYSGHYAAAPGRTNVKLYGEDSPLASPAFDAKVRLLETINAYARAKDPRVRQVSVSLGATWRAVEILRSDGETYRDVRPLVASASRSSPATAIGRKPATTAPAAAKATNASSPPMPGTRPSTKPCARRW